MTVGSSLGLGGILVFTFALAVDQAAAQQPYRCTDKYGKTEYRDFQCDGARPKAPPSATSARADAIKPTFDAQSGLPTDRAAYERLLDDCLALRQRSSSARELPQWTALRCDRVMEFEAWKSRQSSGEAYVVEAVENGETVVINNRRFKAKTYCSGIDTGTRVKFVEGSSNGRCVSAKVVDLGHDRVCNLWCE